MDAIKGKMLKKNLLDMSIRIVPLVLLLMLSGYWSYREWERSDTDNAGLFISLLVIVVLSLLSLGYVWFAHRKEKREKYFLKSNRLLALM